MMEAQSLLADRKAGEIERRASKELEAQLKDSESADLATLERLAMLRQFGAMVARAGRLEGPEREAASWLLSRERLLTTLMTAVGPEDSPDAVLKIVARLHQDHGEKPAEFPELTAALAVVYDSNPDMTAENARAPEPEKASRLFAYYTRAFDAGLLKVDARRLPWQLGVFVVMSEVSEGEMEWAARKYAGRPVIKDVIWDVRYEENPRYTPAAGQGGEAARSRYGRVVQDDGSASDATLEQLTRGGGTTRAIAHFGVSVCRAVGVPSAQVMGRTEQGAIRNWLAVMELSRDGRVGFDLGVGVLDDRTKWPGVVMDGQSGELVGEEELALLAELQGAKEEDRLGSVTLARLAEKTASGASRRSLFGARGRSSAGLTVEAGERVKMLLRAVRMSPGNRVAWAALRQMGRDSELTAGDVEKVMPLVGKYLAPRYPAVALDVIEDVVSWRGTNEQMAALDAARGYFTGRRDLQMRMMIKKGDLLLDAKREREALAAWGAMLDAAGSGGQEDAGPAVIDAMERVDKLLRAKREGAALVNTYKSVWARLPMPRPSGIVQATAWYQVGQGYAAILEESGKVTEAGNVRQRLRAMESGAAMGRVRR
jgi:hypothetical protein